MINNIFTKKAAEVEDRKVILSTLWIFVTVNYIYCDVIGIMDPGIFQGLMTGHAAGGLQITQECLLGAMGDRRRGPPGSWIGSAWKP
jgi:hypothetical protein